MAIIDHLTDPLSSGLHTEANIDGTSGDDELEGTDQHDVLNGLDGNDALYGYGGDDRLNGGTGGDLLNAFAGDDTCLGGAGDDYIKGGPGDDYMDGGSGIDRVSFYGSPHGVRVDLNITGPQNTGWGMDTLVNIEDLSGTQFADRLIGDEGDNVITTGGGAGDLLVGNGGDDLFALIFNGSGTMNGGAGADSVQFSSNGAGGLTSLIVDLNDTGAQDTGAGLWTLKGIENVSGSDGDESNDIIIGNGVGNVLAGALADDQLTGNGGADLLLGDGAIGVDWPLGISGGSATVYEGVGTGADSLDGGTGADTLVGGGGGDELTGGAAGDVFLYLDLADSGAAGGVDLITDLDRHDTIDLSAIDADVNTDGDQAFHLSRAFHGHGNAGELVRTYDSGADVTHFAMDVDGDGQADMQIDVAGDAHTFNGFVY